MKLEFSLILLNHSKFGWTAGGYLTFPDISGNYLHIRERLTPSSEEFGSLKAFEKQLVELCDHISDEKILERFGKKKVGFSEFYKKLDPDLLNLQILPFISRKIHQILQIVINESIPLYKSDYRPKKIFQHDIIRYGREMAGTIFNFIKSQDNFYYYLSVRLGNEEFKLNKSAAVVLLNYPCYLLIGQKLLYFEDIDGKKLLPFLEKDHLVIPPTAVRKYLESFVQNALLNFDVRTIGFKVEKLHLKPQAVLVVESGVYHAAVIRLEFHYAPDAVFRSSSPENSKAILNWNEGDYFFRQYFRHEDEEGKIIRILEEHGLSWFKEGYFITPGSQSLESVLSWLRTRQAVLIAERIQVNQHFGEVKYQLEECRMDINVVASKQKLDWFDLHGQIRFGEFAFPIVALRSYILRGIREFPLPDGSFGLIPDEWFLNLEMVFQHGVGTESGLSLQKHYVGLFRQASSQKSGQILSKSDQLHQLFEIPATEVSPSVKATLRPYQVEGYSWLNYLYDNGFGGCLADDMGLGKTLQTLALLQKVCESAGRPAILPSTAPAQPISPPSPPSTAPAQQLSLFPEPSELPAGITAGNPDASTANLIVVPTSLVHNWHNEIRKFTPTLKVSLFVGAKRTKSKMMFRHFDANDLIITTYGTVRNDIDSLKNYNWNYIVLDESQTIKNPESKIYQAIMELKSSHRLVLTGTPIENSLKDLWAQMNFLNPGLLGNLEYFKKQFVIPVEGGANSNQAEKLQLLTRPFVLRRTKEEVATDLPDLTQLIQFCEMTPEQKEIYQQYKMSLRNNLLSLIEANGLNQTSMLILQGIQQLRQLANHPRMVDPDYKDGSGKMDQVIEILENLWEEKHKVLIFSNYVKHLDLFRQQFIEKDWRHSYLTGSSTNREQIIEEFQQEEDRLFFLISMKAGGVGLNLTQADYILILDPWWNPAVEMQAVSRAHRIGQNKKVFVYRFISEDSIEEKIQILQERKKGLADQFINTNNPIQGFRLEEIRELFD